MATVHLLESANLPAVAALTVKAYVERPYSLSSSYVTVGLPKESVAFIPIDVDPTLDLNEIKTAVKPSIATCVIERSSTNSAARIRISGNREELIAAKRVIVDLSYQNEKTNWDLRDSLTIELFDSLACRVVPSIPKIVNDRVSFMLFRKEPFDAQKLKCLPKNCEFQGTFANKSDKIVTVEGQVLHALDDPRLEISDGSFSITVPLASL